MGKGWEKVDQMAKSGVGLMFMHYAVHPDREEGEKFYRPWIGGNFETDFSVSPHWVADLEVLPDHSVSRCVGFTGGHYHRNWSVDGFRTIVINAITWTSGVEIPAGGVKSKPLTEDELNANLDDKGKPVRLKLGEPDEFRIIPTAPVQLGREVGCNNTKD